MLKQLTSPGDAHLIHFHLKRSVRRGTVLNVYVFKIVSEKGFSDLFMLIVYINIMINVINHLFGIKKQLDVYTSGIQIK